MVFLANHLAGTTKTNITSTKRQQKNLNNLWKLQMYAKLKPTKLKPSSVHLKCNLSRKCIGAYCTACGADMGEVRSDQWWKNFDRHLIVAVEVVTVEIVVVVVSGFSQNCCFFSHQSSVLNAVDCVSCVRICTTVFKTTLSVISSTTSRLDDRTSTLHRFRCSCSLAGHWILNQRTSVQFPLSLLLINHCCH